MNRLEDMRKERVEKQAIVLQSFLRRSLALRELEKRREVERRRKEEEERRRREEEERQRKAEEERQRREAEAQRKREEEERKRKEEVRFGTCQIVSTHPGSLESCHLSIVLLASFHSTSPLIFNSSQVISGHLRAGQVNLVIPDVSSTHIRSLSYFHLGHH